MKAKKENETISDYKQVKATTETLGILEEIILEVKSIVNSRKYLRDMQKPKKFITNELKDNKLKITRIK